MLPRSQNLDALVFTHQFVHADELHPHGGPYPVRAESERHFRSGEARRGRQLEQVLAGVIRVQAARAQLAILNETAQVACECVAADWVSLHWSPPGQLSHAVRAGVEAPADHTLTLTLAAPPGAVVTGTLGVLRVGRAGSAGFDRHDRVLLGYLAQATVLAAENVRLLAASEAASAGKDDMLAMVSHDLRSPLSLVLAGATELLEGPVEPSAVRAVAESIGRATGSMSRLLADLLDGAQVAAGTFTVTPSPLSAALLLSSVERAVGAAARARGISLEVGAAPAGLELLGDRERLMQVFANLLCNALKFTPRSGHVGVELAVEGDRAVFRVRDSGPGVAADHRQHVFTRFWKGSDRGGAGLGLYIAKTIVDAHGGCLELEPANGAGAVFRFDVPLVVAV